MEIRTQNLPNIPQQSTLPPPPQKCISVLNHLCLDLVYYCLAENDTILYENVIEHPGVDDFSITLPILLRPLNEVTIRLFGYQKQNGFIERVCSLSLPATEYFENDQCSIALS